MVRAMRSSLQRLAQDRSVERRHLWHPGAPTGTWVVRLLTYAGAVLLIAWMADALYVVITHNRHHPVVDVEGICDGAQFSCSAVAGVVGPLLSLALASAVFLAYRLRRVRRPYTRAAKKRPKEAVPTAGRILDEVVGRDELCNVIIADLHHRATRRPHVIVGGVGTGKTAVLVRLTQLLAARRAVPVAVRLRDAQGSLDFGVLARKRFLAEADRALLSDEEGARVWRRLLKDDRIVVLADGLEEALTEGNGHSDRDNRIRLALQQASRERLPVVVASRPHDPLRGMDATIIELEPLSEEAALRYIRSREPDVDERRLDWVIETAEVSETPLYLQITRELHRKGLLQYVARSPDPWSFDARGVDRAELRLRLLQQWRKALVRGDLLPDVPLRREHREDTVDCLAALACIGLGKDTLEVKLQDFDDLYREDKRHRDGKGGRPIPLVDELSRRLTDGGKLSPTLQSEIRLAATRGMELDLVEARGESVRFQHSIIQSFLGADFIGAAMRDDKYWEAALDDPGRELLISLVLDSRARAQQGGVQRVAPIEMPSDGDKLQALPVARVLADAAGRHSNVKALDLFAAALQVDAVHDCPQHEQIATELLRQWGEIAAGDARTLEEAKLNLVHRYGETMRTITGRLQREQQLDVRPAYLQLFQVACLESEYSVRLAAAQEIGAGGDAAFEAVKDRLGPPTTDPIHGRLPSDPRHLGGQPSDPISPREAEERQHREQVMKAWLAPLLVGSAQRSRKAAEDNLEKWLDHVRAAAAQRDDTGRRLSVEVALALGFKYAANRRRRHPQAREEARAHLAERASEILRSSDFWFTRLILIQALCLWRMPDRSGVEDRASRPDFRGVVQKWGAGPADRTEHPFVTETRWLAVRALETGQPERYVWIDEDGIVSRIGSRPADPVAPRKHNLWISPSAGWTALHPRAQQLVADVLLLLHLSERGRPADRERRLQRTRLPVLPPCLAGDRSPLNASRSVDADHSEPGSNCAPGCLFELCPYPSKGEQHYRHELSEAFCRRQQHLVGRSPLRSRPAPWQAAVPADLRAFWKQMGQPRPEDRRDGQPWRRSASRR